MTRDLRTLIYLLNLELEKNVREHWARAPGMGWNPVCNRGAAAEADAIGREFKRTQSGSSSRSGRDREQQLIIKAASSS